MKEVRYIWQVSMEGRKTIQVEGRDKLEAIQAAAQEWKVRWTVLAREADVLRLRKAPA